MEPIKKVSSYTESGIKQMNDTVMLNIGGTRFEVMKSTLQRFPDSKLGCLENLTHHYREHTHEYYFDRSPFIFDVILNFYRFGELHVSTNLCSESVQKELDYWEISDQLMEDCCWVPYNSQIVKNSSLNKFKQAYVVMGSTVNLSDREKCRNCNWARIQPKMWAFLDDHESSRGAKVFACVSVLLVLLTTFTFVAETLPEFKQNATAQQYDQRQKELPSQVLLTKVTDRTINTTEHQARSTRLLQVLEKFLPDSVNISVPDLMDEIESVVYEHKQSMTQDQTRRSVVNASEEMEEPYVGEISSEDAEAYMLTVPIPAFEIIDMIAYAFFTIELMLRIIFCPRKAAFFKNSLNIIDILALLPYYVELIVQSLFLHKGSQESFLNALYVLRIVRIFRVFRMVRHHRGLKVLAYTLKASAREIGLMGIFLGLGMLIFSSLIFYTKSPEDTFTSIPHAFWWAVVTMTTVGYGDMVPKSGTGYLIGSFCALSGVLVISFTVPVIVNNFMLFYQHVEYNRRKSDIQNAKTQWRDSCRESLEYRASHCSHGRLSVPTICIEGLSLGLAAFPGPMPISPGSVRKKRKPSMHVTND